MNCPPGLFVITHSITDHKHRYRLLQRLKALGQKPAGRWSEGEKGAVPAQGPGGLSVAEQCSVYSSLSCVMLGAGC